MSFSPAIAWWVLAGLLVAAELLTGTVYLLALSLGAAAGALAAHAGLGLSAQMLVAALAGGGATALWHVRRARHPRSPEASANPDVNLDIGQEVQVDAWDDQGLAQVRYRGAAWTARHAGSGERRPGPHRIVAIHGNRLDLARAGQP